MGAIPVKILASYFVDLTTDSEVCMESQKSRMANTIPRNKVGGMILPDFKTY